MESFGTICNNRHNQVSNHTTTHESMGVYYIERNAYGVKYEIVCSIGVPQIIWVSGPWKGSASDPTIAKHSGILEVLGKDEMLLADKIYRGDSLNFLHPVSGHKLTYSQKTYNYLVYSARQSIERVIERLKIFGVFHIIWRYSLEFHKAVVISCCKLVNLFLIFEPLG